MENIHNNTKRGVDRADRNYDTEMDDTSDTAMDVDRERDGNTDTDTDRMAEW